MNAQRPDRRAFSRRSTVPELDVRRETDRLERAIARPRCVQDAVRIALRDAIAWRIGGGAAPTADAFATAAVSSARLALDGIAADADERSHTLSAVQQAARRFTASALGRRLMSVRASQFVRLAKDLNGPDAIVRDRTRRIHAIVLRLAPETLEAGRIATAVANAIALPLVDRLAPMTVHVFALTSGRRWTFQRDAIERPGKARVA